MIACRLERRQFTRLASDRLSRCSLYRLQGSIQAFAQHFVPVCLISHDEMQHTVRLYLRCYMRSWLIYTPRTLSGTDLDIIFRNQSGNLILPARSIQKTDKASERSSAPPVTVFGTLSVSYSFGASRQASSWVASWNICNEVSTTRSSI